MKFSIYFICALFILVISGCAGSPPLSPLPRDDFADIQSTLPTPVPVDLSPPGDDIYRVGPGDILLIKVYEEPELSGRFSVSRKDSIYWSWIGEVKVSGMSLERITEELVSILKNDYIRDPLIKVDMGEYHSQVVYFFGNVADSGVTRLGENKSLLHNFLQAGGPKTWGDSRITILRNTPVDGASRKVEVGLQSLLKGEVDINLGDRDIITVTSPDAGMGFFGEDRVYVLGAVVNPRALIWREKMTALDALMGAGGLSEDASGNGARLIRGAGEEKQQYELRMDDIMDGERQTNYILLPGDQIIVPESFF